MHLALQPGGHTGAMQPMLALISDQITARYELISNQDNTQNQAGRSDVEWEVSQASCDGGWSSSNAFNLNDAVKFQQETHGLVGLGRHSADLSVLQREESPAGRPLLAARH